MISAARVSALISKDLAEARRNRAALIPVVLLAVVAIAMPFFIALAIPALTGESLASDRDLAQALAAAGEELGGADALSDEGAVQAFVFARFLIFLLLIPVTGAITFAAHSLIGEKQGRTLEPLLATPLTTVELLLAKVLGALLPSFGIALVALAVYAMGVVLLAEPGVARALMTPHTLLLVFGLGPLASLVALQSGVLVSSRVNDPRTAQQISAFVILPLSALFMSQLAGAFVLTLPVLLLGLAVLLVVWVLLVLLGVALFEREAILTKWK